MFKRKLRVAVVLLFMASPINTPAVADWPMPGSDIRRSSWTDDTTSPSGLSAKWHRQFAPGEGFIPSIAHIIAVTHTGPPDKHYLYIPTSKGVYCLDADNNGNTVWFYPTVRPVGNSPTVVNGVVYIPCFDKKLHAVDAITGKIVWTTQSLGAGFRANPLVVNGKVYAGCRDGKFYCFNAADGSIAWQYDTGSVVNYSACYNDGVVYFGDMRMYAYALNADTGALVWKSQQLEGDGFYGYWPVIYKDRVIFSGTNCYMGFGRPKLVRLSQNQAWPAGVGHFEQPGPIDAQGWIDGTSFVNYLAGHPDRRTFFVLNQFDGTPSPAYTPILWVGNNSGCRYPPLVKPGGNAYVHNQFKYSATESAAQGWLVEWQVATPYFRNVDYHTPPASARSDVVDEPDAWLGSPNYIFYLHHSARGAGWMRTDGTGKGNFYGSNINLESMFPGYNSHWEDDRRYGDPLSRSPSMQSGTHGYQNPPVPFNGNIYMHVSNSVLCFGK